MVNEEGSAVIGFLLSATTLAATLTVTGPGAEDVAVYRPMGLVDAGAVSTAVDGSALRATFDGGWVDINLPDRRISLFFDPEQHSTLDLGGGQTFAGDGADALALLDAVQGQAARLTSSTLPRAERNARKLRVFVAKRSASLDPAAAGRAVDLGLGLVAERLAAYSTRAMFEDPDWYRRTADALGWTPTIEDVPSFWIFGFRYGRQAAGVKTYGAVPAVARIVERTDDTGRDAMMYGAISWALESADTAEELAALEPAIDAWDAVDHHPALIAHFRELARERQALKPGSPAPRFAALGLDGAEVRSEAFDGQATVLDFWGTWCGPCIGAIPKLQALQAEHPDVRFVALAKEDPGTMPKWRATIKRHGWTEGFVHLYSEDTAIHQRFQVAKYPTYALIDAEGRVVSATLSFDELEAALAE